MKTLQSGVFTFQQKEPLQVNVKYFLAMAFISLLLISVYASGNHELTGDLAAMVKLN